MVEISDFTEKEISNICRLQGIDRAELETKIEGLNISAESVIKTHIDITRLDEGQKTELKYYYVAYKLYAAAEKEKISEDKYRVFMDIINSVKENSVKGENGTSRTKGILVL